MKHLLIVVSLGLSTVCWANDDCLGPSNSDAFPTLPVSIQETQCEHYQSYEAISPTADYNDECGYSIALGPMGQLMYNADGYSLTADWGDELPTASNCAASHVAAQAWGYRCLNSHCTQGTWEKIGAWKTRAGHWNTVSNTCYLQLGFNASDLIYSTVQLQAQAWRQLGTTSVPKRVKGRIYVFRRTGQCLTLPASPPRRRHP